MRDVMGLCLLTSLRNPVFLSYSPKRAVSNMGMVRTDPITPTQVEHLAQLVQKRLVPLAAWAAGHKLTQRARTLQTHRIGISGKHRLCNFFSRFIWNSCIYYVTLIIWAYVLFRIGPRFVRLTIKLLSLECSILCSIKVYLVAKC